MITFHNERRTDHFAAIEDLRLDRGVVSMRTQGGGGFFTVIPISPADYRAKSPTRASARYEFDGRAHRFDLTDDWGTEYRLLIDDAEDTRPVVEANVKLLTDAGLLKASAEAAVSPPN